MARELPLNGLNGKVTVQIDGEDVTVEGQSTWTRGADSRTITPVPTTFGTERDSNLIQQKGIISWSISGYYLPSDPGQQVLKDAYDNNTELSGLKLWLNETDYVAAVPGDFWRVSELAETTQTADGFATYGASGFLYDEFEEGYSS